MINRLVTLYAKVFSKPPLSKVNSFLFHATLRGQGYNNYQDGSESGEEFFISKVLAPSNPRVCVDVGANVGDYSRKLLKYTQAQVVSFEPLPAAFLRLQEQTEEFRQRSILENRAVGEKNDRLVIHYNPSALAHASLSEDVKKVPYVSNESKVEVEVVSLDAYFGNGSFESIDFIKIDTEGFESEVIKGAKDIIRQYRPKYIQLEYNWHQMFRNTTLNSFAELLPEYDVFQLVPGGWMKRDSRDPIANIYCFSNFVFALRQ